MNHRRTVLFLVGTCFLALLAGCGSSDNKSGVEQPISTPGVTGNIQAQVLSVSTPAGGPPVVTFTMHDENGNDLDPRDVLADTSLGTNRVRFFIGRIETDGYYRNYCNGSQTTTGVPSYDKSAPAASRFAKVSAGTYTYTFYTNIDNASQTLGGIVRTGNTDKTHTVAIQILRRVVTSTGKTFEQASNPYINFRPDGGAVTVTREVAPISTCNECHGTLALHGGGRRDVALCILCHYPGVTDPTTGSDVDMKAMVHKIHMGEKLPSNVAGGDYTISTASFKTVAYPFISRDSRISVTPIECVKCHRAGKDYAGHAYGRDVDKWKTGPTKNKCTTCHDTLTFDGSATITVLNGATPVSVTAARHDNTGAGIIDVTGANADNTALCSGCHSVPAFANAEYDISSVPAAHTVLEKSSVFTGIRFQIISVDNAVAGRAPVVRYKITTDNGVVIDPLASTSSFSLKLGYMPTGVDYTNDNNVGGVISATRTAQPQSKSLKGGSFPSVANGDGSYTVAFENVIPAGLATGTGVIGMEGVRTYSLPGTQTGITRNVGGVSIQYYFNVATGAQVTSPAGQRRVVVDGAKCNVCHFRLAIHGGNRVTNIQECVICHNPKATDFGVTFSMMFFIHKLHTGESLDNAQKPFWGFEEVRYPNDRRNCLACHVEATPKVYGLPLPAGVLGTVDNNVLANSSTLVINPMRAACMSCHSDETYAFSLTHVQNQTVGGANGTTELCLQCHTTGLLLGPDFAHELPR